MLRVTVNTKGGGGKTTTSTHVLAYLLYQGEPINVVEIDNNNVSSIFHNSQILVSKSITTDQKELRRALSEAVFDPKQEYIIDAGGGDDSLAVIREVIALGEEVEFYIPIQPDRKTLHNVKETVQAIGKDYPIHLILNNFYPGERETAFWFIYGDEDNGFEANLAILRQFNSVISVPHSRTIGQAEAFGKTVGDVALAEKRLNFAAAKAEARAQGLDAFDALLKEHNRGLDAIDFLDSIKVEKRK